MSQLKAARADAPLPNTQSIVLWMNGRTIHTSAVGVTQHFESSNHDDSAPIQCKFFVKTNTSIQVQHLNLEAYNSKFKTKHARCHSVLNQCNIFPEEPCFVKTFHSNHSTWFTLHIT